MVVMLFDVKDVVFVISPADVYDNGGHVKECNFVIGGRAPVQNGWKCFLRSRRQPVVYDPKKQEKNSLREAVRYAFKELDNNINFPVFQMSRLQLSVSFYLVNSAGRDIDNMVKFLQDAIEGVVFDNDKFVYEIRAYKHEAPYGNEATTVKVALLDEM
jgi:Holliday junction resolvase RusA-like endonuclease